MSVSLFFGLPGVGKTTLLAYMALKGTKDPRYENVWTNVCMNVPGVTVIPNDAIGKYQLENGLLLIDEATLFADSRAHKEFGKDKIEFFLLHRHYNIDIVLFTQQWDGVDRKIRVITDRVYYVYKTRLTGKWITKYYRIPYGIVIPDPKRGAGEKLGEIIQGYSKPPLLVRLFAIRIFRPPLYKYFDSWEKKPMEKLPATYRPYLEDEYSKPIFRAYCRSGRSLIRWHKKHMRRKSIGG